MPRKSAADWIVYVPYASGEAGAVQIIDMFGSLNGRLERAFGVPEIALIEKEFPLPRGRPDFVLFHQDGSVSIVEVKDYGADRDILCGVGQLMSYAVQIGFARKVKTIRCLLVVAATGDEVAHLRSACERAGVVLIPLGRVAEHEAIRCQVVANAA